LLIISSFSGVSLGSQTQIYWRARLMLIGFSFHFFSFLVWFFFLINFNLNGKKAYLKYETVMRKMSFFSFLRYHINILDGLHATREDSWAQFHQHSMYSFGVCWAQKHKKDSEVSIFLRFWDLRAQKRYVNTLVILTPGLNFINFLWAAFMHTNPESAKNTVK